MSVKVTIDISSLDSMVTPERLQAVSERLCERVAKDCESLVPKRTGALRETVRFGDDEVSWTQNYATYVYQMPNTATTWTTPGTTSKWFDAACKKYAKDWGDTALDVIKEAFL